MGKRKVCGRRKTAHLARPRPSLLEQVRSVPPERLGILAVDPAKDHCTLCLGNVHAEVLLPPFDVAHRKSALNGLVETVRAACARHGLQELVVAIERTGTYYHLVRDVLKRHWKIFMVHPSVTKKFRQAIDPGNKTDATDLFAAVRAAVVGYARPEAELPEPYGAGRLGSRERENLVGHRARFRVYIQEQLHGLLPGFAGQFSTLWDSGVARWLVREFPSAAALHAVGLEGLRARLREAGHVPHEKTLAKVLLWAADAPDPAPHAELRHGHLCTQLDLLEGIESAILALERPLADFLVQTPFVLLMSARGIAAVSAARYAAELGPVEDYASPKQITGRAGLFPSRYQSAETDRRDGPLVTRRNARLRDALIGIAHDLLLCNPYVQAWAEPRVKERGWGTKQTYVAVANKFARISFAMLHERRLFRHPLLGGPDAILRKLLAFAKAHALTPEATHDLLQRARTHIPQDGLLHEAQTLGQCLPRRCRRGGPPERLGNLLRDLLADLVARLPQDQQRSFDRFDNPGRAPD
jgi:transposase